MRTSQRKNDEWSLHFDEETTLPDHRTARIFSEIALAWVKSNR
jgi:hypothetical protein